MTLNYLWTRRWDTLLYLYISYRVSRIWDEKYLRYKMSDAWTFSRSFWLMCITCNIIGQEIPLPLKKKNYFLLTVLTANVVSRRRLLVGPTGTHHPVRTTQTDGSPLTVSTVSTKNFLKKCNLHLIFVWGGDLLKGLVSYLISNVVIILRLCKSYVTFFGQSISLFNVHVSGYPNHHNHPSLFPIVVQ